MSNMRKFLTMCPWLLLGPITGPLAMRGFKALRNGDNFLAVLYFIAIVFFWIDLGASAGWSIPILAACF